jgi:LysR family hydrogen peroxide-inducible transcriptional activator
MEFNPIRYFPNLAGSLNFIKDMRSGVSQPALTRAIQQLEQPRRR